MALVDVYTSLIQEAPGYQTNTWNTLKPSKLFPHNLLLILEEICDLLRLLHPTFICLRLFYQESSWVPPSVCWELQRCGIDAPSLRMVLYTPSSSWCTLCPKLIFTISRLRSSYFPPAAAGPDCVTSSRAHLLHHSCSGAISRPRGCDGGGRWNSAPKTKSPVCSQQSE